MVNVYLVVYLDLDLLETMNYRICILICILITTACTKKIKAPRAIVYNWPSQVEAILIDESAEYGVCEPTICISPINTDIIMAGSILDNVYVSNDSGRSWTKSQLKSSAGVYGDPVIVADYQGRFYYSHLSNPDNLAYRSDSFLDRIVVQRSDNNGETWTDGSAPTPTLERDQDKQWKVVDKASNAIYMTWTEFDKYGSDSPEHKSRILFSKSTDLAESWSEPMRINQYEGDCIDSDQTTEGAVPAVGPRGELYVSWSYDNKIYFDRSWDKGESWLDKDIVIADQTGGWDQKISGISRTNGMPITKVNLHRGDDEGTIYVCWSDQRNGEEDTDIWLASSKDNGQTWSKGIRVNDDKPGKQQFFPWMDIDPVTGYIYVVFYDRRDHDDDLTDVYVAYSKDAGATFTNKKISAKPFKPSEDVFFGDYNNISAVNNTIRPIWTHYEGGRLSIWTALIDMELEL